MRSKLINHVLIIVFVLSGIIEKSFGQGNEISKDIYLASAISDSLKKHANTVVRYSEIIITIKAPGKASIKLHNIITVLNEKGQAAAEMAMPYNKKYDTYSGMEMNVFDANGLSVKKYHKSDMYDGSEANNTLLVTDERFLAVKHPLAAYPATIEKVYEEDRDSFIDLGGWVVQQASQSVQNAVIKVIVNPSAGFRYKAINTHIKPVSESLNGLDYFTWKFSNLKAIRNVESAAPWKVLPEIEMAVDSFNFYGYPGDFSNWKSFGKWVQSLNSDVCTLSPQRAAAIKKMTDSIKTEKGKAEFLYHYLQKNVRYVAIQLGIGGYKPFPADFVDEKKYGDCKALSNYMLAMLKAVNIKANYVIVGAGYDARPLDPSFPRNTFNHVILCVPFNNDTTWLECTSNTQPFGKLGPFTENRGALLITEDGGKLVNTPGSAAADNQFNCTANIILGADGGAKTNVKIAATGIYRSNYISYSALTINKQKEVYTRLLNMRQSSVFNITSNTDNDGIKQVDFDMGYDKFCDIVSADKLFLRPFAFDLCTYAVPAEEKRKTDFHFGCTMEKSCTTTISLPAGFEVETMPASTSFKFTYGSYEINYVYNKQKNEVTSTAKFIITNAIIPPENYSEMQEFLDAVAKEQRKKLVVRRKG